MLSGKSLKMMAFQEKKLFLENILPTFQEIKRDYATLLGTYTLYDIPAEGGLSYLDTKTAGSYLCVWKTAAPAYLDTPLTGTAAAGTNNTTHITLAAGASAIDDYYNGMVIRFTAGTGSGQVNIITDYNGSTRVATVTKAWGTAPAAGSTAYKIGGSDKIETTDISAHTHIIISGLTVNSYNQIQTVYNKVSLGFATIDGNFSKVLLSYMVFVDDTNAQTGNPTVSGWGAYGVEISRLDIHGENEITHKNIVLNNVLIKYDFSYMPFATPVYFDTDTVWSNIIIENTSPVSEHFQLWLYGGVMSLQNVLTGSSVIFSVGKFSGTPGLNLTNVHMGGGFGFWGVNGEPGYNVVFARSLQVSVNSVENYIVLPEQDGRVFNLGNYSIDYTLFDFDNFIDQTAEFGAEYVSDVTLFGKGTKLYYMMRFISAQVDDNLKRFGDGWIFAVQREDFEYELVTAQKYIKNFKLYNEPGCTTEYDYQNDENFLILGVDAQSNKAALCWFGNMLYSTILSGCADNTVYTVTHCFQIWTPETRQNLANIFKDHTTRRGVTNSPMSGEVRFNNLDNEILFY
jgi:hypothetical protein